MNKKMMKIFVGVVIGAVILSMVLSGLSFVFAKDEPFVKGRETVIGETKKADNVNADVKVAKESLKEKRAELSAAARQKLDELKKAAEENKAKIQQAREESRTRLNTKKADLENRVKTQKEELKNRLAAIKDEKKKKIVEKLDNRFTEINNKLTNHWLNALTRLENLLLKISSRTDKAEANGKDAAPVRSAIEKAKTAIASARVLVEAQLSKTYPLKITVEEKLKSDVAEVRNSLNRDLKLVKAAVQDAHKAVVAVLTSLKKVPNVDKLEEPADTDQAAPSTSQ